MSNISILESYGRVSCIWDADINSFKCTWYNGRITRNGYGCNPEKAAGWVIKSIKYIMNISVIDVEASCANR